MSSSAKTQTTNALILSIMWAVSDIYSARNITHAKSSREKLKDFASMHPEMRKNFLSIQYTIGIIKKFAPHGDKLVINSLMRSPKFNASIKGASPTSEHLYGGAVDFGIRALTRKEVKELMMWILFNIPFNQFLYENTWLHISVPHPEHRDRILDFDDEGSAEGGALVPRLKKFWSVKQAMLPTYEKIWNSISTLEPSINSGAFSSLFSQTIEGYSADQIQVFVSENKI